MDSEHQLIAKSKAGDVQALEQLLFRYHANLDQYVRSRYGERDGMFSADDIVQETMVTVFRCVGQLQGESVEQFWGWLRSLADSRMRDAVRYSGRDKRGGKLKRINERAVEDGSTATGMIQRVPIDGDTPSAMVAGDEAADALRLAIASLPEEQRVAVKLRYLQGATPEEAAAQLQRTPSAVRSLLRRARVTLREAMRRSSLWLSKR
ncbi:MAG: sigma-70 family RNA polymerase sigma factor [Pirellulaceae bacterium]|nr:sigma-70 family RNA polymerase sigma factor [Planctomycetales bacterium]